MDALSSDVQQKGSAVTPPEEQQSYYQRIFCARFIQRWCLYTLLLVPGVALCICLAMLINVTVIGVFAGIIGVVMLAVAASSEPCALVLLTLCTTEFIPRVASLKTLNVYPIALFMPFLLLVFITRRVFEIRHYNWPALRVIWPMIGLVALGIISNVMIQLSWSPGVEHQENGNPLVYSEVLGILLYLLPLVLVIVAVALLTNRERWIGHIISLFRVLALLAASIVLIDFARLHTSFYAYRFAEPTIGWISLQGLAMPISLGCIVSYTFLLHGNGWQMRLLCTGELLLCMFALCVTLQNSWWIEVVIGIIIVTALYSRRLLVALILIGIVVLVLLQGQLAMLQNVKAGDVYRLVVWQDMLRVWETHPLLGVGPGNVWTYDQHLTHLPLLLRDFNATGLGVAHNGYLQVLAELGPLGVVLLLALLFLLGLACWRLYQRSSDRERLPDRILALAALGLLGGSAVADITSGAFFYLNSQIGGFNALPTLLNNWMIFALVLYKDQTARCVPCDTKAMGRGVVSVQKAPVMRKYRRKIMLEPSCDDERQHILQALKTYQWIPGTSGFIGESPPVVPEQAHSPPNGVLHAHFQQMLGVDGERRERAKDELHGENKYSERGADTPAMRAEISSAAGGAAIVGAGNIVGSLLKYASNFFLQVGFGAALYGLYAVALSLILLVANICDLGLDITGTRYVAIYRSEQRMDLLKRFIIFVTRTVGSVGLIGALLVICIASLIDAWKQEHELALALQLLAPAVPLLVMQTVWLSVLQGFQAFAERVVAERILMPIVLIVLLVVAFLCSRSLIGIELATLASFAAGTVLSLYFLVRQVRLVALEQNVAYSIREWLSASIPNFMTSIIEEVLEAIDLVLLALFAVADTQIGQYSAAVKISDFIAMPLFSFNVMFAPSIAELYSKGEHLRLARLFQVTTRWIIMLSLPIYCIVTLFSYPLLSLSQGNFAEAWPLLTVSAIGTLANAATGSIGYMLLMTRHQKLALLNSLLALLLNIVGGILLIPLYGAMAMAITTSAVLVLMNVVRVVQVHRLLHVSPYCRETLKPVCAGIVSTLLTGGLLLLLYRVHAAYLWIQFLLIPVFLVCYAGLLFLLKESPEDVYVVDMLRTKIMRSKK